MSLVWWLSPWTFFERFYFKHTYRRFVAAFGGPSYTYQVTLVKKERNNL